MSSSQVPAFNEGGSTAVPNESPSLRDRLAALIALVALAAAVVVVVADTAKNWRSVLLTLVGLLVIVVSGWYVVSRRGVVRFAAVVVALVGAALLIIGLVLAEFHGLVVLAVCVLAGLSVAAATLALHRNRTALRRQAAARSPVMPARRPVLIMNPKSGGGKAEKFRLVDQCKQRGIEPIVLQPGDDLTKLAEDAIARGADVIGMAGGDGSQALVAAVAIEHDIPHVVVPAGTRNHFALDLGLDRDDVVGALDAFSDAVERRVDLARVNDRIFVNNASLGIYAKIVQSPEYRDAKRQTAEAMLPQLLGVDAPPLDLRFTGPDGSSHTTAHMVLVSNNPYQLVRFAGRGTRERLDLGVLGVVAARIENARDASRFVALEAAGKLRRFHGWIEWAAPRFRMDSAGALEIGVDGEALKMDPPLLFVTMPGALRVRLPRHALGRSPAARAVHVTSRSTIAQLVRVIRGVPA